MEQFGGFGEAHNLVLAGRDVEEPVLLVACVDAVTHQRLLDSGEVLAPELIEPAQLVAEALEAVLEPVGEGGVDEPSVSTGCSERDVLALEEDDLAARRLLLRLERSPEACEPAADDGEVGLDLAGERGAGGRTHGRVEPERSRFGLC